MIFESHTSIWRKNTIYILPSFGSHDPQFLEFQPYSWKINIMLAGRTGPKKRPFKNCYNLTLTFYVSRKIVSSCCSLLLLLIKKVPTEIINNLFTKPYFFLDSARSIQLILLFTEMDTDYWAYHWVIILARPTSSIQNIKTMYFSKVKTQENFFEL